MPAVEKWRWIFATGCAVAHTGAACAATVMAGNAVRRRAGAATARADMATARTTRCMVDGGGVVGWIDKRQNQGAGHQGVAFPSQNYLVKEQEEGESKAGCVVSVAVERVCK